MDVCEPWPLASSCLPDCWSPNPEEWTEQQRAAVETAYAILSKLTAGVYGLCRVTLRPCRQRTCVKGYPYLGTPLTISPWVPVLHDGKIFNVTCQCPGDCGCGPICEVPLDGPVHDIVAVRVDGEIVEPTTYRVDRTHRGDMLVKESGPCWPECQDLELPDNEPGTWSVTYRRGTLPDADGELALTLLALEVDKLCHGRRDCVLSERVVRVVREGIEIELDTTEQIRQGATGIAFVDRWVGLVNPYGARLQMRAYSPDTVRGRRTIWPFPEPRAGLRR